MPSVNICLSLLPCCVCVDAQMTCPDVGFMVPLALREKRIPFICVHPQKCLYSPHASCVPPAVTYPHSILLHPSLHCTPPHSTLFSPTFPLFPHPPERSPIPPPLHPHSTLTPLPQQMLVKSAPCSFTGFYYDRTILVSQLVQS